jgi:hypothetical protein
VTTTLILIGVIVLLAVALYIFIKLNAKKGKELKQLKEAVENQKRIIKKFQEADNEAKKQKDKLGKGSTSDRVNASIDVLRDIENDS